MVQFFERGPTRSALQASILGPALGEGLGNYAGQYQAGRAIDQVLNDPSLRNAPLSVRQNRLAQALRPFGQRGQQYLQQQLMFEQQQEQQRQQQQQQQQEQQQEQTLASQLWNMLNPNQNMPQGMPSKDILELEKIRSAERRSGMKAPPGGISGQPVPPEIAQKIPEILNANTDASADDLAVALDSANIPRAYSGTYIENRRRQEEAMQKIRGKESIETRKQTSKFLDELVNDNIKLKDEEENLKNLAYSAKSVSGPLSSGYLADKFNMPWLESPGSALFKSGQKKLFEDFRSIFPKATNADLKVYENQLPQVGRNELANKLLLQQRVSALKIKKERNRLQQELVENNPEWPVGKIKSEAEKKLEPFQSQELNKWRMISQGKSPEKSEEEQIIEEKKPVTIRMRAPNGRLLNVPSEEEAKRLEGFGAIRE